MPKTTIKIQLLHEVVITPENELEADLMIQVISDLAQQAPDVFIRAVIEKAEEPKYSIKKEVLD